MRDKYEISIWNDILVPATNDAPAHYEEEKFAVIGSDTMTSHFRTYSPKLVENVNGTNTLTFKMYYISHDENNVAYSNPFIKLLVNEQKIKCFWKDKWYDMIIKNIQEDSSGKSVTYTCKDLYVNELSKNGYNLEFDEKLNNNQGTAAELVERVLEGTEWQLGSVNDTIRQEVQEPVYEVNLTTNITATNDTRYGISETIVAGSTILVFYNQIHNILVSEQTSGTISMFQFLYATTYEHSTGDQLVTNADSYHIDNVSWTITNNQIHFNFATMSTSAAVSSNYRGNRLVRQIESVFDPILEKLVDIYTLTSGGETHEYHKVVETTYGQPTIVNNIVVNNKNFATTEGWIGSNLLFRLNPLQPSGSESWLDYQPISYLRFNGLLRNEGPRYKTNFIQNGFQRGEEYVLRFKIKADSDGPSDYITSTNLFTPHIGIYNSTQQAANRWTDYFTIDSSEVDSESNWITYKLTCTTTCNYSTLLSQTVQIGLDTISTNNYWLEELEVFQYRVDEDSGSIITPDTFSAASVSTTYYKYYDYESAIAAGVTKPDEIEYQYINTVDWTGINAPVPKMNSDFRKIRSISIKESNRFNILQTIAETFQCWVRFDIEHDATGRVIYDDGRPRKYVSIRSKIGEERGIGFIYGIDLKSISRTVQSDKIVTKTIVAANSNKYGQDGFCAISRSNENYPRESFILNFDYYINQGLLNGAQVNKDLYLNTDDSIGYYIKLHQWNTEYEAKTKDKNSKLLILDKLNAYQEVYNGYISATITEMQDAQSEIMQIAGIDDLDNLQNYRSQGNNDGSIDAKILNWKNLTNILAEYQSAKTALDVQVNMVQSMIAVLNSQIDALLENIEDLHTEFNNRYARFIQEGTWKSDDYMDDNLYYLDAQSVAYTSSRPQVSYNISVIRISGIEGFENKIFHLGDITYIQDTEFFGYMPDHITPYKEKVLVSEITSNFDEPQLDTIKVQNYKAQFEDLFQRITSTTQALQYAAGEYNKAANILTPAGDIEGETLQNSIAANEQLVYSARNDRVISDSTGITVSDENNSNSKTKITSGGVFITTDGGLTWKNAVKGSGISTEYLTAGSIGANKITILDEGHTSFRWDGKGLNAFDHNLEQGCINLSKYVRFNHLGIFGAENIDDSQLVTENDVWDNAKFGMTWKGFFIKNRDGSGGTEVSSENDILIKDANGNERIKIGRLNNTGASNYYGIRIDNADNVPVLVTDDTGDLWLRNLLTVGNGSTSTVKIGYNPSSAAADLHNSAHEVIHAGASDDESEFVVYEDGYLKAAGGTFTGEIHAQSGTIGNLTIGEVEQSGYRVEIISNNGTIFKNNTGTKQLTAILYKGGTPVTTGLTYRWKKDGVTIPYTTQTIEVGSEGIDKVWTYTCEITVQEAE